MKIIQKIASISASLALMLGFSASLAGTASAASCPSGRVCIWDGAGYSGSELTMTAPAAGHCKNIPYADYKNMAGSFYNNSGHAVYWYDADGCAGASIQITPNATSGNFSSNANNKTNSFFVCNCQ